MTEKVWTRKNKDEKWKKIQKQPAPSKRHGYADSLNELQDRRMYWVSENRPSKDKVPDGK